MKLLLDTHAWLWWLSEPERLLEDARLAIANGRSHVSVSAISFVEVAIKETLGKLRAPAGLASSLETARFCELPLTVAHAAELRQLPLLHKDPFDRVLVAQARAEGLTLVSRDPLVLAYDVPILAA